jgi:hypothetical protein
MGLVKLYWGLGPSAAARQAKGPSAAARQARGLSAAATQARGPRDAARQGVLVSPGGGGGVIVSYILGEVGKYPKFVYKNTSLRIELFTIEEKLFIKVYMLWENSIIYTNNEQE